MKLRHFLALLTGLVCSVARHDALGVTYSIADLGSTYIVNGYQAKVLNDLGEVIGNDPSDNGHAFLFSNNSWHDLGTLNTSGSGTSGSVARGLNNLSVVVGQSDTGNSAQTDAFLRAGVGGTFTALNVAGTGDLTKDALAVAINDLGTIIGTLVDNTAQTSSPFVFQQGGAIIADSNASGYPFAINRYGDILGRSTDQSQALINGAILPKTTDGFVPRALNNAGQILLSVDNSLSNKGTWGLIYDYGTAKVTKLANLSKTSSGYTAFNDINDFGQVVGRGSDASAAPHAIFYSAETGVISLDALNFSISTVVVHLVEGHGINNKGQIVCTGYFDGDAEDVTHVFLLTPDTIPVLSLVAAYDGLANLGGLNLGAVTVSVSKTNIASFKLVAPGVSYSFKVTLTNGTFNGTVTVTAGTLTINVAADTDNHKITGTIADSANSYTVTAIRQAKLGIFAGSYTALLQGTPPGVGHALVTIGKTGAMTFKGAVADGSGFTGGATMHYDGSWTFYAPLYTKTTQPGSLAGTMNFNRSATDSDCSGTLKWNKQAGLNADVTCKAALYKAPKNAQLLKFTDTTTGVASFTFADGGQALTARTLSVSNKNAVAVTAPNPDPASLAVKFTAGTGAMAGSFLATPGGSKILFSGVVQQKLNVGAGVFLNQGAAGAVLLTPQ